MKQWYKYRCVICRYIGDSTEFIDDTHKQIKIICPSCGSNVNEKVETNINELVREIKKFISYLKVVSDGTLHDGFGNDKLIKDLYDNLERVIRSKKKKKEGK